MDELSTLLRSDGQPLEDIANPSVFCIFKIYAKTKFATTKFANIHFAMQKERFWVLKCYENRRKRWMFFSSRACFNTSGLSSKRSAGLAPLPRVPLAVGQSLRSMMKSLAFCLRGVVLVPKSKISSLPFGSTYKYIKTALFSQDFEHFHFCILNF